MVTIPKQLQNPEFRFCLIRKQSKVPYEKDWQKKGYKFDDFKFLEHKGNYGVIGGYGNLRILDKDKLELDIDLDTFCVETGRGGKHYYFASDYDTNHVFINEMGELRAKNYQVVGPNCIHPNGKSYRVVKDMPIKNIPSKELKEIINPYIREELPLTIPTKEKGKDTSRSGLEYRKAIALFRKDKTRKQVYEELMAYKKFADSVDAYKERTLDRAEDFVLQEKEPKEKKIEPLTPEEIDKQKNVLGECYEKIIEILKEYMDIKEEYYSILALWILGTYIHDSFPSYPYLFINAMRGSGKTRLLKLISILSANSEGKVKVHAGIRETLLYRFKKGSPLILDECEDIGKKYKQELREYFNASYKRGVTITRSKKVKTKDGEDYILEEFEPYRPIAMANIWGMEEVLGDRCITIILEKSNTKLVTMKVEDFDLSNPLILGFLDLIKANFNNLSVVWCHYCSQKNIYSLWNNFIKNNKNDNILDNVDTTQHYNTNNTKQHTTTPELLILFNKIKETEINGRNLELTMPLFFIANLLNEDVLNKTIKDLKELVIEKKEEELMESRDVTFLDFVSQIPMNEMFKPILELTNDFKRFYQEDEGEEKWINTQWVGQALKRLKLIKRKRRLGRGREVILDIPKAQEKIKMFK